MKTIEQFSLKGILGGFLSNLLLKAGAVLRSAQAARCLIQSDFKSLQGWRLHSLPGQPAPVLNCPNSEKTFLVLSMLQCMSLVCHPPAVCCLWLCLLGKLAVGTGGLLLALPKAIPSPRWKSPGPSASSHRIAAPPQLGGPLLNLFHFIPLFWGEGANCST